MTDTNHDDVRAALAGYTLSLGDAAFVHQHVVDALGAQEADDSTPPVRLTFALVGLYLHVEQGYSGRRVQQVHAQLAARRRAWPRFALPQTRGAITAEDVLSVPGARRVDAIDAWCAAVWEAYGSCRDAVIDLLR